MLGTAQTGTSRQSTMDPQTRRHLVTGWRRVAPGAYRRGLWEIRREDHPRFPGRPWVLLRATVKDGYQPRSRHHTLTLAKLATGGQTSEAHTDQAPQEPPPPT